MPKYAVKIKLTFIAETIVQVDDAKKQTELLNAKLTAEAETAKIARQNLENKGSRAPVEFRLAEMKTLTVGTQSYKGLYTKESIQQPEPLIITSEEMTTIDLTPEKE